MLTWNDDWYSRQSDARLWNLTDGTWQRLKHAEWLTKAKFSPDGRTLATGDAKGTLRLWNVADHTLIKSREMKYEVSAFAFSADGTRLVVGTSRRVILCGPGCDTIPWGETRVVSVTANVPDVSLIDPQTSAFGGGVDDVAFAGDGRWIYVASGRSLRAFDAGSGKLGEGAVKLPSPKERDEQLHLRDCRLALSLDGSLLVSGGIHSSSSRSGKTVEDFIVWETRSGRPIANLYHVGGMPTAARFSHDGGVLATNCGGRVQLWDLRDAGRDEISVSFKRQVTKEGCPAVEVAVFSPDRKTIAVTAGYIVEVADTETGKVLWSHEYSNQSPAGVMESARCLAFSPDGKQLIVGGEHDEYVNSQSVTTGVGMIYNAASGEVERKFHTQRPIVALFAPKTSDRLVAVTSKKTYAKDELDAYRAMVWKRSTFELQREISGLIPGISAEPQWDVSDDGRLMACNQRRRTWDLDTGTAYEHPDWHPQEEFARNLKFSTANSRLLRNDGTLSIYDTTTWRRTTRLPWTTYAHCSPVCLLDGRTAAYLPYRAQYPAVVDAEPRLQRSLFADRSVADGSQVGSNQNRHIAQLAFGEKGRLIAITDRSEVLEWSIEKSTAAIASTPAEVWSALATDDAAQAYRTMQHALATGSVSAEFLRERLAQVAFHVDPVEVDAAIADLDKNRFDLREAAQERLSAWGAEIAPQLRSARDRTTSLEVRKRLDLILNSVPIGSPVPSDPARLQALRGRQLLRDLERKPAQNSREAGASASK